MTAQPFIPVSKIYNFVAQNPCNDTLRSQFDAMCSYGFKEYIIHIDIWQYVEEIRRWCDETFGGDNCFEICGHVFLRTDEDLMAIILRWGQDDRADR